MERCALRERDYYDFRKVSKDNLLLFYILLIALIFITLFLCGFLFNSTHYEHKSTSNSNIPEYIGNLRIKTDLLYKPLIKRLIFMVIDGLRWDFIAGPIGKTAMPLTSDILTNDHGCLIQAKLQAPTVTMPRIKAMMTGTVPNFVDVILNFGSKPLHTDNLLSQAKAHGYKLIFYGDETWLSLFPNIFDRHDGTTSFFVTDFTEVDNNVTRHIQDELSNDDWDVMILHYLGLDHIGHVEGPFGPSIKPKLQEMDKIVAQIAQKVQNWNGDGEPTLFIVCGDHGIKDSGGHGGSTPEETTVPIITIGGTMCIYEDTELKIPIKVQQLDIAVTLSAALGLPIPSTSLGSVFLDYIYNLQDDKRLFLLNYNSRQLFDHYQKFTNETESSSTVPQATTSTFTNVNHPQSFTSFVSNNEITKKQNISNNRIEIINHNLSRAIVSTNNVPSTMPQATASTSISVKRPQNFIDSSMLNNEITKKQKTFDKRIEVINHHLIRAIVSTNNMPLGLEHLTLFRGAMSKEIDKIVDGFIPKFHDSYIKFGAIVIKCVDQSSLYWLSTQIDTISPWPEAKLKMIIYNELQKYFRACVWIPGPFESSETVLKRLNRQNPDLNTANWQIFAENLGAFEDGRSVFLGVPESDFKKLEASNFMAYLGLGQVNFAFNVN